MIAMLRRRLDRLRGTGEASVTVPPMDGAFRPNNLLETAGGLLDIEAPDNLAHDGRRVCFSSGATLLSLCDGAATSPPERIDSFAAPISCLAGHPEGILAIGLESGQIEIRGGAQNGKVVSQIGGRPLHCPTALAFGDAQTLMVCLGSRSNPPQDWKRDLMERNASGSVWRLNLSTGEALCLGSDLGFPFGVSPLASGAVVVSEAWRHRLVVLDGRGAPRIVVGDLPGYPARIAPANDGGYWLCIFAPRRQMVEFVLREPEYRTRMLSEVPEPFWMAPALSSGLSFKEPLQGGAVKHLGIDKPWAPTRSYGLLVRLDAAFSPVASAHSRSDGKRHGITSALALGERVLATSKGGGHLLAVDAALLRGEGSR